MRFIYYRRIRRPVSGTMPVDTSKTDLEKNTETLMAFFRTNAGKARAFRFRS